MHNTDFVRYEQGPRFDFEDYMVWYESLREDQREWLRGKAKWEGYTTARVAMEWGVSPMTQDAEYVVPEEALAAAEHGLRCANAQFDGTGCAP